MKSPVKIAGLVITLLMTFADNAFCQLTQNPPIRSNSYNYFGSAVQKEQVKAYADYIAKNLK